MTIKEFINILTFMTENLPGSEDFEIVTTGHNFKGEREYSNEIKDYTYCPEKKILRLWVKK